MVGVIYIFRIIGDHQKVKFLVCYRSLWLINELLFVLKKEGYLCFNCFIEKYNVSHYYGQTILEYHQYGTAETSASPPDTGCTSPSSSPSCCTGVKSGPKNCVSKEKKLSAERTMKDLLNTVHGRPSCCFSSSPLDVYRRVNPRGGQT